jgi:hypothetical protein
MRSSTVYINIFLLVLCAGCTPYQHLTEEGEELMGYYDHPMPGGIADIGYYASCHSRDSTVYGLALRRAQEYCQENGYQTFQIITHSDVLLLLLVDRCMND